MTGELFLSRFTPSMMSAEVLEKVFVQRGDLADRLVEIARESVLTPSKHHTLVIGSRGIGKTHLLSLVQNRIASEADLSDKVRIAWLREEEWGVASFLDFLYRILRALATEYADEEIRRETEELFSLSLKTAEKRAGNLLRNFLGERTLLLIAENLDSVFDGLKKKGQQRLRAYLQEESSWTILASSQAIFNGVTLFESPFYGFFDIHHLQELTVDDAARLVQNIAELADNTELAEYVQSDAGRARIRAVHHLAGGNHRVYMILSEFLTRDNLDQLVEPFLRMMDDLTPYYQARMEHLSPQQRKIIDLLCSVRGAVPVKEIAKRCFISSQTASSQLKDLRSRGYVSSTPIGRDAYYELAEPLMRLALEVKNQRNGHIRLFVDFLRHWYARTELVDLLEKTPSESALERQYLRSVLQNEGSGGDPAIQSLLTQLTALARTDEWTKALPVANKLIQQRGGALDWILLGECLTNLDANQDALAAVDRALSIDRTFADAWVARSGVLFGLGRDEEALEAITTAIDIEADNPHYYRIQRSMLQHLERHEEAVQALEYEISYRDESADLELEYAQSLSLVRRFEDAAQVYERVIGRGETDINAFTGYVLALSAMGKTQLALDQVSPEMLGLWLNSEASDDRRLSFTTLLLINLYLLPERERAATIYNVYSASDFSGILGAALVSAVGVMSASVGVPSIEWVRLWRDLAGGDRSFELPLRLLNTLAEYRGTDDPRVLLRVSAEERRIVSELLLAGPQNGVSKVVYSMNVIRTVLEAGRGSTEGPVLLTYKA